MQTRIRFKGWPAAVITLGAFVLQFVAPSKVWALITVALGLALVVALVWAKSLQHGITLTRERRYAWAQVGDRLEERFSLRNTSLLPALWVEIADGSTLPDYTASRVTGLGSNTAARWRTGGVCTRRGIFQLGPLRVRLGDPLGLVDVEQYYPNTVDFMVVPPVFPLPALTVADRGLAGEHASDPFSLSRSQAAAAVRPFQPGDPLTKIHWPTTARRNSFYTRRMEATSSGEWWLALDLDSHTHSGRNHTSTLEKAILVASSLADRGLAQHRAVGLLAQGEHAIWMPPLAAPLQRWQILKALAQASVGQLSLDRLLARLHEAISNNASLVVITASTRLNWLDPLLLLARRGIAPTVVLLFTTQTRAAHQAAHRILVSQGIQTHLVDQSAVTPPLPEHAAGQWQWRVTGTGKAIPIHKPQGRWQKL
ncbi:MAG: DUF58 domain-containing protein [Anaerolineae bacterium]